MLPFYPLRTMNICSQCSVSEMIPVWIKKSGTTDQCFRSQTPQRHFIRVFSAQARRLQSLHYKIRVLSLKDTSVYQVRKVC